MINLRLQKPEQGSLASFEFQNTVLKNKLAFWGKVSSESRVEVASEEPMTQNQPGNLSGNENQPGEILSDRYRVISKLGEGGMGVVYQVEHVFLQKEFALKTIYKHLISDVSVRRFQAEAKAASAVEHPSIVKVHDFGVLENQTPYLVMEILRGQTLSELLNQRTLKVDEATAVFIQVCFALAHAHEKHVIHRDIKPSNIMLLDGKPLSAEGSVKLLDFGIAKLAQHDEGEIQALTKTGEIFGSPLYMSPEQCQGLRVDHRSDVYSLGCVLFESLTGTSPFVGENALTTMMLHSSAAVPSLKEASLGGEFPIALENIVQKMLAKDPADRYQNLGAAALDLANLKHSDSNTGQLIPRSVSKSSKQHAPSKQSNAITLSKETLLLIVLLVAIGSIGIAFAAMQLAMQTAQKPEPLPVTTGGGTTSDPDQAEATKANPFEKESSAGDNSIVRNLLVTDADLRWLNDYPALQHLTLNHCTISDEGLSSLRNSKLLSLNVIGCESIRTAKALENMPYLQLLHMGKSGITDEALDRIADLNMLSELHIKACKNITPNGLKKLTKSKSLRYVYLERHKFRKSDIEALAQEMPACTFVEYAGPKFSNKDKDDAVAKGAKELPPYKAPPAVMNLPPDYQSQIMNLIADKWQSEKRLEDAYSLRHRASRLLEKSENKRALADSLFQEAVTLRDYHGAEKAVPLVAEAYPLILDTCDHSQMLFYERLYQLANIAFQAKDTDKVQDICEIALKYARVLLPKDKANIDRFVQRESSVRNTQ